MRSMLIFGATVGLLASAPMAHAQVLAPPQLAPGELVQPAPLGQPTLRVERPLSDTGAVDPGPEISPSADKWRYVQKDGTWWYYTPEKRWLYWKEGRWVELTAAPSTPAVASVPAPAPAQVYQPYAPAQVYAVPQPGYYVYPRPYPYYAPVYPAPGPNLIFGGVGFSSGHHGGVRVGIGVF